MSVSKDLILVNRDPGAWDHQAWTGTVSPVGTTIVYLVDDPPGPKTCEASCSHCWYRTGMIPAIQGGDIHATIDQVARWSRKLTEMGFTVQTIVPDAFGRDGLYLRAGLIDAHMIYDQDTLSEESIAWTSGRPLLNSNTKDLLDLAWERGHRVVAMTLHEIGDGYAATMRGTPSAEEVIEASRRVLEWRSADTGERFRLSLTFTLDARSYVQCERYIAAAALIGVDYVRFNRFLDFTERQRSADLVMSGSDNSNFFHMVRVAAGKGVAEVVESHRTSFEHTAIPSSALANTELKVLISTDFGKTGTENLGLDLPINRCPGGVRLFGLRGSLLYPCGEIFHTPIGRILEVDGALKVLFDPDWVRRLGELHERGDGCIGGYFFNRNAPPGDSI